MKVSFRPYFVGREAVWEPHREIYKHCVGAGWLDHLDDLTEKLEALGWNGELEQVKEKFGTLRFYWVNNIEGIFAEIAEDIVSYAEERTAYICEACGKNGSLRGKGWIVCRCQECWDKEQDPCTCKGDFTCEVHRA